jgi:arabinogalactan endo-1,4-beta-galactosidase
MRFSLSAILLSIGLIPRISALTYHGADFSSLVNLENAGRTYHDSATSSTKLETILAAHGTNLARIRIWTSTNNADYSLTYGLALAKRAAAAGMAIMLDMHYSDTCVFKFLSNRLRRLYLLSRGRSWSSSDPRWMVRVLI